MRWTAPVVAVALFATLPVFTERVGLVCAAVLVEPGAFSCPPYVDQPFSLLTLLDHRPEGYVWTWMPVAGALVAAGAGLAVADLARRAAPYARPRLAAFLARTPPRDALLAWGLLALPSTAMHWWNGTKGGIVNLSRFEQLAYAGAELLGVLALPFTLAAHAAAAVATTALHRLAWWSRAPDLSPFRAYGGEALPEYLDVGGLAVALATEAVVVFLLACALARGWERRRVARRGAEDPA